MNKLSTVFAIALLSTTIGCKRKPADERNTPATKPTEGEMRRDERLAPATPDKTAAATELPTECKDYKASMEKLRACEKLPQETRDSLQKSYDTASASWANASADGRANLAASCKTGNDAVTAAAKQVCGW